MATLKEKSLRKTVKDLARSVDSSILTLSWVESPMTSAGIPDLNYCCYGREGWVELKAGPDIEIRPTQVAWFKARIEAGGWPLFLIKWGETYTVCPGSAATSLRRDPSEENVLREASRIWVGQVPEREFLRVLKNPEKEYETARRNVEESGR